MYYLETGSTNPYYNLAFEEYVLSNYRDGDYLILWQNDNTIVLGQNQNAVEEINQAFVDAHHIRVVRRCTGGGAVYHDLGNLNYSLITDAERGEETAKRRFSEPVVRALQGLGIQAELSGRNDILVECCKVSGTAQRLPGLIKNNSFPSGRRKRNSAYSRKADSSLFHTSTSISSDHNAVSSSKKALNSVITHIRFTFTISNAARCKHAMNRAQQS